MTEGTACSPGCELKPVLQRVESSVAECRPRQLKGRSDLSERYRTMALHREAACVLWPRYH